MRPSNHLMLSVKSDKRIIFDQKHLVPITNELLLLNKRWQRTIKEEKERRRKACMHVAIENELVEQYDADENQPSESVDENIFTILDERSQLLNTTCIKPVTMITVPNVTTRENIARQYTLNRNQEVAFMIITGHLDGIGKINDSKVMTVTRSLFLNILFLQMIKRSS